ncbi:MAG: LPS export ABC transporter permease LptF [Desulfovibrionaceae bacterium]
MTGLLHRHVLRELLAVFLLALGCLMGIILLGRLLQLREILLSQSVHAMDLLQLFLYLSPLFLMLVMPIATMLAVFLTFLRMSTDNELVALKASGVSLYQLVPAPLVFSLLSALAALYISYFGLSWGMDQFRAKLFEMVNSQTQLTMQAGIFNQSFPGLTFYANQVDEAGGDMRFVFVQDKRQKGTTVNIVADRGRLDADQSAGELRIFFENGHIYRRDGKKLDVLQFGTYTIRLPLDRILKSLDMDSDKASEMSVAKLMDLREHPEDYPHLNVDPLKVRMELTKRQAMPAGCFVLGLFAMPIACVFRGMRQQYGLILSMGLFLVYYAMFSLSAGLGESGVIAPEAGMWGTNGLFLAVGLTTLRLASREKNVRLLAWWDHLKLLRRGAKPTEA